MRQAIDFTNILDQLKTDIADLAKTTMKGYINDAKKDAQQFLLNMKDKLKRWTELLAKGDLTTDEFVWLLSSQKDLVEMSALKHAGVAAIRIDQFKSSLLNLIVDTVFDIVKV